MLKGIDVSHYQRFDNYQLLNQSQLAFVFIKASEGIYKDRDFATHSQGFAKTCLLKGAYHFLRFKTTAKEQAANFIKVVRPQLTEFDLPPVLDVEDTREDASLAQCEDLILEWLTIVKAEFGKTPIIYTGGWYWSDPLHLNNSAKFNTYPLWTSRYSTKGYLPMYGGWQKPTFWQFTDKGFIEGLQGNDAAIDLNYFLGDIDALWELASQSHITPSSTYNPKVEAVQYMLNLKKFNAGTPDGIFGDFTVTAFHNWLAHNGMPKEDRITPKHWQLLFGLASTTPGTTVPVVTAGVGGHTSGTGSPPVPSVAAPKAGIVTANKLNIRAGASQEHLMVAQPLNKGQGVTILEEKNGWYKVKTEIEGWVSKAYVS